ncbi:unnamed protein product [Caenorhabditis auriculariae]|uniref:ARID domain-containing protein n=1 Tax=Caenorhabditis auriculariae TaxID=2777116 RepID=A0A8S1HBD8_9PELO|nr:unnamed protein product [Caenorhabditis auriculariae]
MERRKRKSAIESYIDSLSDPPEKIKKSNEFYYTLRNFFIVKRWNAPLKVPYVQGAEVDLHRLYETVMAFGGWQKVAIYDRWADVSEVFGIRDDVVCGDHAIKLIYMRYLSKFEQVETMGDVDDYMDSEMSRSRGRTSSFFATNDCPVSQSRVSEYLRRDDRFSGNNEPDYGRLVKSLLAGLPNEVDFAVNVCMLLSHAGPRQLRIAYAPSILTLLAAHGGIFDDDDEVLADMSETWRTASGHDFEAFWASSGIPKDMLLRFMGSSVVSRVPIEDDENFFTAVVTDYNVKDPVSWRMNQIATIIRNLSFEPVNRVTMASSWPTMKFLLMCAKSKWAPLYTAALDALSNLACDINLSSAVLVHFSQHGLLQIIREGIFSNDKFKLIRSLEILTGLCNYEGNESLISEFLSREIFEHILDMVVVKDIMMCVYTLECLYQISEMGDLACQYLAQTPRAINQLVSMATLEAVSFGPAGLAGMKVVEYQPQGMPNPPPMQQTHPNQSHPMQPQQPSSQPQQPSRIPSQLPPPQSASSQMTVRQAIASGLVNQPQFVQQQQQQASAIPPHMQQHMSSPQLRPIAQQQPTSPVSMPPTSNGPGNGESQVEQLTEKWIRVNCVFDPAMSTPRGELYAAYVDDLRNQYHSLSGSLAMFSNVMKHLYPEVAFRISENGIMIVAQGIRLVRPHRLAPAASATAVNPATPSAEQEKKQENSTIVAHPLMKQMLSKDSKSNNLVRENGINGHNLSPSDTSSEMEAKPSSPSEEEEKKDGEKRNMNGHLEICQEPVTLSESNGFIEGKEVRIERREQNAIEKVEDCKKEKSKLHDEEREGEKLQNGTLTNGTSETTRRSSRNKSSKSSSVSPLNSNKKSSSTSKTDADEVQQNGVHLDVESSTDIDEKSIPVATTSEVETDFMCEWDGCGLFLTSSSNALVHLTQEHATEELAQVCKWPNCDGTQRSKWSLITHLQDHHCTDHHFKLAAQRRREGIAPAKPVPFRPDLPRDVPPHPGYAKHAAMDAIRRHAFNFLSREITDEPEGPVTKSIRLTSCLILRNLARYSAEGRHFLRRHEPHLCWLALSRLESSHALAQLLAELHAPAIDDEKLPTCSSSNSLLSSHPSSQYLATPQRPPVASLEGTPSRSVATLPPVSSAHRSLFVSSATSVSSHDSMPPPQMPFRSHQSLLPQPQIMPPTPLRAGAGR